MENENQSLEVQTEEKSSKSPKSWKKWTIIAVSVLLIGAVIGWVVYNAIGTSANDILSIPAFLAGVFIVTALGYLLGRITIKGVSLGTAGVFLIAILFGFI